MSKIRKRHRAQHRASPPARLKRAVRWRRPRTALEFAESMAERCRSVLADLARDPAALAAGYRLAIEDQLAAVLRTWPELLATEDELDVLEARFTRERAEAGKEPPP